MLVTTQRRASPASGPGQRRHSAASSARQRRGLGFGLPDWGVALAVALVSRLAVLAAGYVVTGRRRVHGAPLHWSVVSRLTREWASKDGGAFIAIARGGYGHPHSAAFFPLYPLALRGAALLTGGDYALAGVLLSLTCYAVAMVLLYRLTAAELDTRTAALAVAFISVFPTALTFGLVYSESLFLLLTVAAFFFARRGRWPAAGVAGMLAVATRSSGLALLPALLLLYGRQQGWSWRSVSLRRPRDLSLGWLALIPLGLLAFMAYLWWRLGDPLAFSAVERSYLGAHADTAHDRHRARLPGRGHGVPRAAAAPGRLQTPALPGPGRARPHSGAVLVCYARLRGSLHRGRLAAPGACLHAVRRRLRTDTALLSDAAAPSVFVPAVHGRDLPAVHGPGVRHAQTAGACLGAHRVLVRGHDVAHAHVRAGHSVGVRRRSRVAGAAALSER